MKRLKRLFMRAIPVMTVLFFLCVTFVYAMFQGGFVSWFLFYSFAPFGCYSLAVMLYPLQGMNIQRALNQSSYRAGDELKATITITRKSRFPLLYLLIEDELPHHLVQHYGGNVSKIIVFPFFRKEIEIQYSLFQLPRGEYIFNNMKIRTGDFFGLVTKEAFYVQEEHYVVYPKIALIKPDIIQRLSEGGADASRNFFHQASEVITGIREYQAGDRFAWVDWKAFAKKNQLVSKEFEPQKTSGFTVVMDGSARCGLEARIVFTASILSAFEKRAEDLHFISLGDIVFTKTLKNSSVALKDVFRHLAVVQGEKDNRFPDRLYSYSLKQPPETNLILVVTEVNKELEAVIEMMVKRGHHVMSIIVIPEEYSLTEPQLNPKIQWRIVKEREFLDSMTEQTD